MTLRTPDFNLSFQRPAEYLTMNWRGHTKAIAPVVQAWRTAAAMHMRNAINKGSVTRDHDFLVVRCEFPFPQQRKRDPSNWFGTVKPIIDGFTDARLWPDDDETHVALLEPRLIISTFDVVTVQFWKGSAHE